MPMPKIELTGHRFGRYLVISENGRSKHGAVNWLCRCDCGEERIVPSHHLVWGKSRSCGCLQREVASRETNARLVTHGHSGSPEYIAWTNMKARCYHPTHKDWHSYGGRSISVCNRWILSFDDFLRDVGYRPSPQHTIDRIDVDGDYEPNNVKWSTRSEQNANQRRWKKSDA